jgi:uncharacterized protein
VYRSEKSVKLQYSDIPEEGVRLRIRGEDAPWEGLAELSVETAPSGHLFLQKRGRNVLVEGEVRAALWFECSRCLERFLHVAELFVQQVLRPKGKERVEAKEMELHGEDLEFGSYDEENIPLASVVEEHLLLSLPMRPLCREGCKGLCPQCGANRNHEGCKCLGHIGESPFDSLKKFVVQKR